LNFFLRHELNWLINSCFWTVEEVILAMQGFSIFYKGCTEKKKGTEGSDNQLVQFLVDF